MESTNDIKQEIFKLLSENFGSVTEKTFREFYQDESLPVILNASITVLGDLLGRRKACEELNIILKRFKMEEIQYE